MSLLAKVDSLRETAATAQGDAKKAANADLEAALKALLKDLAFREVPEVEAQSVEAALCKHATALKLGLLRSLGVVALHRALVGLPGLLEQMRRMLAAVPHTGAAAIVDKALGAEIEGCTDMQALESCMEVLEFLVGQGRLKKEMGAGYDTKVELPGPHKESCNGIPEWSSNARPAERASICCSHRVGTASYNKAKKALTKLEHERKAKAPEKALAGVVCVRYATNEAFDVADTHDGHGFTLGFDELDAKMAIRDDFEGAISYHLVREDRSRPIWGARTLDRQSIALDLRDSHARAPHRDSQHLREPRVARARARGGSRRAADQGADGGALRGADTECAVPDRGAPLRADRAGAGASGA